MRGAGGCGAAGRAAIGAADGALAEATGGAAAEGTCAPAGGITGRAGGALTGDDVTGDAGDDDPGGAATAGLSTTGGATTGRTGITGATGGAAAGAAGDATTGRLTPTRGTTGFSPGGCALGACSTGRATGRGATTASLRCVIAFSTSPGREMCDRSIFVLISSSPRTPRELDLPAGDEPSAEERRYTRTFSASCSSRELECVFFSVTPTTGSVSRMALLLTSSSRARSLIRTLLIRPFVLRAVVRSSLRPHGVSFFGPTPSNLCQRAMIILWFRRRVPLPERAAPRKAPPSLHSRLRQ